MPQTINFNKYQKRSPDYHWQQISGNLFRFNAYVAARYRQVLNRIPRRRNIKILDIGCGDGVLLSLISRGKRYGIDTDQSSLNYAAGKVKAKFIRSAAESLPFHNNFFDVVIATEIIEHLRQPQKLLAEARRVLKTGGRLILTTPVKLNRGLIDPLHVREFSSQELKRLCGQYFRSVTVSASHPLWLRKIYTWSPRISGRYYFDFGRWLINVVVLLTGWNPFLSLSGKSTQQLVVGQK